MLEYNVRSASIIGYVGAGGIGLHLKLYAESADSWNKFSLVLLCILVIVTVLDFTGEKIRKSIRDKLEGIKNKFKLELLVRISSSPYNR